MQLNIRALSAAVLGMAISASAMADAANHVVADYGSVAVPFTRSIGDTFSASQAGGFVAQDGTPVVTATVNGNAYFYDDYIFSLPASPEASFNAAAVSIDLGSFLSLQNFQARLYKLDNGLASLTTGVPSSGTPIKSWTSSALLTPGFTGTTVLFQNVGLQAGASYALEFRGTIAGSFGGSYGGNLNITPVPEPGSHVIALAALGLMGVVARRRAR